MEILGFHLVLDTNEKIRLGGSMISRQGNTAPEGYIKISKLLDDVIKNKYITDEENPKPVKRRWDFFFLERFLKQLR